jgi:hypothetical protein
MPTGYTSIIEEGASFEEYVWRCARAFGALIELRDEPLDAPVPAELKPNVYYARSLDTARAQLAALQKMGRDDADNHAESAHYDALKRREEDMRESERKQSLYEDMRAKVLAWAPPTSDHAPLREFMLQQIEVSIGGGIYVPEKPDRKSGEDWLADAIRQAEERVAYAEKSLRKEEDRTRQRNAWLSELRKSVPVPQKARP